MTQNKYPEGEIFHVFNKSISNYQIFGKDFLKERLLICLKYYNKVKVPHSLSLYLRRHQVSNDILESLDDSLIKILAFCIMPDHYHLLIKILVRDKLSKFVNNVENSYSRYFNILKWSKGPSLAKPVQVGKYKIQRIIFTCFKIYSSKSDFFLLCPKT